MGVDIAQAALAAGADANEDFIRSLHAHTDGLPLFVVNVLVWGFTWIDDLAKPDVKVITPNPKTLAWCMQEGRA